MGIVIHGNGCAALTGLGRSIFFFFFSPPANVSAPGALTALLVLSGGQTQCVNWNGGVFFLVNGSGMGMLVLWPD